jgi:hypothetical protein
LPFAAGSLEITRPTRLIRLNILRSRLAELTRDCKSGVLPMKRDNRSVSQAGSNPFRDLPSPNSKPNTQKLSSEQKLEIMAREGRLPAELVPLWEEVKSSKQHDLKGTLDQVELNLKREVVMGEAERIATVLWIAHTYIYATFKLTPRLFITSGDPECGKSTLLSRIAEMSNGGMYLTSATISHLGRVRTEKGPDLTITLDQLDNAFDQNASGTGPMIDRLIAGADRGSKIGLSEKINGRWTPVEYEISFPMALAKIGALPNAALRSRCIVIQMHPATAAEAQQLSTHSKGRSDEHIRPLLAKIVGRLRPELAAAKPSMPSKLINRGADKWRPLLTIAQAAGDHWLERAISAAEELESYEQERPPHITLLCKVVVITKDRTDEIINSDDLDRALARKSGIEGPLNAKTRGKMLRLVGLKAERHWRGGKQRRGYLISDIRRAAEQYIRPDTCDG